MAKGGRGKAEDAATVASALLGAEKGGGGDRVKTTQRGTPPGSSWLWKGRGTGQPVAGSDKGWGPG